MTQPSSRRPAARRLTIALLALTVLGTGWLQAPAARADPATADARELPGLDRADSVYRQQRQTSIAPGLDLTSFQRLQPGGWVTGHVMTADLSTPSLSLDVADGGTVSGSNATVGDFATADSRVVAAVNGDYYDMNASDAPIGTDISSAGLRTAGSTARESLTLAGGKAAIRQLMSGASFRVGDSSTDVGSVNSPTFAADSVGLFTSVWGSYPISRLFPADEPVRVVRIKDGAVTAVSDDRSTIGTAEPVPQGTSVLVGRGAGAARLADLTVGRRVDLTVKASADVDLAVGGSQRLLTDGKPTDEDQVTAGRTAVGVSKDGSRLWVVSIDGRQGDSHGMTIQELAALMADLGAWNALNLDGGGSTTLVARPAGGTEPTLIDRPSDGGQRKVSNALVFRSTASSGACGGVTARPALQPAAGLPADGADQLLIGLSRTVTGSRVDGDLAARAGGGRFGVTGPELRTVDLDHHRTTDDLVVRGRSTGTTAVSYTADGDRVRVPLTVHGRPERLESSSQVLSIPSADATGSLTLTAVDGDGYRVPVENSDVTVDAGDGITVDQDGLSGFLVTPTGSDLVSTTITFAAAGRKITVPVTVGYHESQLADFANAGSWTFAADRATGSVAATDGPDGKPGLGLDFDFSTTTATRGGYAVPAEPIAVPGQPQALALWIKSTGKGEWPRLMINKGDGTVTNLDPEQGASNPIMTWNGWQQVRFPVPAGTPYPISLTKIRFMETRSDASYTDKVAIADLTAQVPLDAEQPEQTWPQDGSVITNGTTEHSRQRIAVMSDTQFVARDPDSPIVAAGRRTLREIVAAKPDLLVIDGDFVDEGSPADLQLAKKILTEEVGDTIPYVYVPGNHEIMGGSIDNFTDVFGPAATHRDLAGTKIITLDSSSGNLHPGGSTEQLQMLRDQLEQAADDPSITGVLVFNHHPVDDPLPDKASRLGDRYEAAALARQLAAFTAESGKAIAQVNGHVGIFSTDAAGGVTRTTNGNSGKSPSGSAAQGGFTGWTMLGLDPAEGRIGRAPRPGARLDWLRIETKARVDELTLTAPATLRRGQTGTVTAEITQDTDRTVPVGWPVSAQWSGRQVRIGDQHGPAVIAFDPDSGKVTALRRGTATLSVLVNGVRRSATITVA
ncbi:phosphodiester glycosidase family protein [Microlunatus soli]|uniref:Calcineurin-like phosphoesterase n=1 Tax=Microlunatus soli TaxID=630515 RepID=A0A1H1V4E9_9ACTN|nr:phosphodiester glycosidase family protein [Microlunatus soli]SDS79119.1 Calcineurin-like phosphoesterase [Microlunatus soli]